MDLYEVRMVNDQPSPIDWHGIARQAIAKTGMSLGEGGSIVRADGKHSDFHIEPVAGGLTVLLRDTYGTKYWLGSPGSIAPVLSWLASLRRW